MRWVSIRVVIQLMFAFILLSINNIHAHEPLFGLGPHTIYQNGIALETELEKSDPGWANHLELLYGITPDWAVTAAVPYLYSTSERPAGPGDFSLRTKYRFFRKDMPGASNQAAFHAGIKFPTADRLANRSSGAVDYFFGASFGYESRRHYFFAGTRYRVNGASEVFKPGNKFEFDLAYGIRPWKLEYLQPDPVFLVEFIGESTERNIRNDQRNFNSGGQRLSIAPGLLFSYRNVMVKAGVKIPVVTDLYGAQETPGLEYVLGLEFHAPPLF